MRVDHTALFDKIQKNYKAEPSENPFEKVSKATPEQAGTILGSALTIAPDTTYGKPETVAEEIEQELTDGATIETRHNQMAILSNTLSPEDYRKAKEAGFSPEETDVDTIVTVVDKIKLELAQSGIDVSDMGGLDRSTIEAYTGNAALTEAIQRSLKEADLPLTAENVSEEKKAYELAMSLEAPTNGAVKYLVDNQLDPTIENIYKAENAIAPGFGEIPVEPSEMKDMEPQIREVIASAGLEVNENTMNTARWMLSNEVMLTPENLEYASRLQQLDLPLSDLEVLEAMTEAIGEGRRPEQAMLMSGYSLQDQAVAIREQVQQITEDALQMVAESGEAFTISNLNRAQQEMSGQSGSGDRQFREHSETAEGMDITLVTARRQLEEVRLLMTSEANLSLLKRGIQIDTEPLSALVEELRSVEDGYYQNLLQQVGAEPSAEATESLKHTLDAMEALAYRPAYALGIPGADLSTVDKLDQAAGALQIRMDQAGEAYETMRTEVRVDLGDNIRKAFRNVDVILQDLDLETTGANERAVRILGYNNLDITEDSINQMKAVDEEVQRTFRNLTPSVVAEMVHRGENPLDLEFSELNRLAESIKAEVGGDETEKYSEFLWKLEHNHAISKEERESYIGIYRLFAQVEKTDGAAIGALVNQNLPLTMQNLITEVRNRQKTGMNYSIDDNTGSMQAKDTGNRSVTDQIRQGFLQNQMRDLRENLTPESLRTAMSRPEWQQQSMESFTESVMRADVAREEEAYLTSRLEWMKEAGEASEEVYRFLDQMDVEPNATSVLAAQDYLQHRGNAIRKLFSMEKNAYTAADGEPDFDRIKADLIEKFGEAVKTPEDMAEAQRTLEEVAENVMKTMLAPEQEVSSLDIRALKLMQAQISMGSAMAKKETYEIPILVQDENGTMSLKIVRGKEQKGMVDLFFSTSKLGAVTASLKAEAGRLSGYIAAERKDTLNLIYEHAEAFDQAFLSEDISSTEVHLIISDHLDASYRERLLQNQEDAAEPRDAVQTRTLYHVAKSFLDVLHTFE